MWVGFVEERVSMKAVGRPSVEYIVKRTKYIGSDGSGIDESADLKVRRCSVNEDESCWVIEEGEMRIRRKVRGKTRSFGNFRGGLRKESFVPSGELWDVGAWGVGERPRGKGEEEGKEDDEEDKLR